MSAHPEASAYFNANWQKYQESIRKDMLCHQEMFDALNHFLSQHNKQPFILVDVGCGDSSSIYSVLTQHQIKKYIGIDAAPDVLKMSDNNLAAVQCKKEYICEDMVTAVSQLNDPIDVMFTSYAVHHLSPQQKSDFMEDCKAKLAPNGVLLMIDGVLEKGQNRTEWLDKLEDRFKVVIPEMPEEERKSRMEHPRLSDFPDSIQFFKDKAAEQGWKKFEVLVDKGIFAFMVFYK